MHHSPGSPPIKAVLFDLDDTLWPIVPVIVHAERTLFDWLTQHAPALTGVHSIESLRARRLAMMKAEPRYAIDLNGLRRAALTEALSSCGADLALIEPAMALFMVARNAIEPFDDVLPALERLKAGRLRLGAVTNGAADLGVIGMAHFFEVAIAAHQFGSAKPDPAIFLAACAALDLPPEQVVYVGDDPQLDVEGAQAAGLRAVWLQRRELEPARAMPDHIVPDGVCADLVELERWLAAQAGGAPPRPARTTGA
jgi:2-haloalkanoic acid dehalogenase type II